MGADRFTSYVLRYYIPRNKFGGDKAFRQKMVKVSEAREAQWGSSFWAEHFQTLCIRNYLFTMPMLFTNSCPKPVTT